MKSEKIKCRYTEKRKRDYNSLYEQIFKKNTPDKKYCAIELGREQKLKGEKVYGNCFIIT